MAATQLKIGASCPAIDTLHVELAANPEMREQARAMIAATPEPLEMRDHISKWRNSLLRQALAQVPHGG